jgi:hypothetical protein
MHIDRVDPSTGTAESFRELMPADSTGINALQGARLAPNGAYAYSYYRQLSSLFLVEGTR